PSVFSGVGQDVFDVFVGVEGDVYRNERFRLTPSLSLHYITADTDSILETGGLAPLSVVGFEEDAFFAELDLKAEYAVTRNFLINGSIGYTHNFMDSDRTITATFAGGGGTPFAVTAPGLGED